MEQTRESIANVLAQCGKEVIERHFADGTVVLIMPYGGRILGLYSGAGTTNFLWTNPALEFAESAQAYYGQDQWHNSGGDRTWLAPEVDIFFPQFPDLSVYVQPPQLDPGNFHVTEDQHSTCLTCRLAVMMSRSRQTMHLELSKSVSAAANPLANIRASALSEVEYAGYTLSTRLEILDADGDVLGPVGLWDILQLPCEGRMLIPTFSKAAPRVVIGEAAPDDLLISDHLCKYRVSRQGMCKLSFDALAVTGRVGYVCRQGRQYLLVIRNFFVNPSGKYIDVPFDEPDRYGFAFQSCKVNSDEWGSFFEIEHHAPAIGCGTGQSSCEDTCQTWAFRAELDKIQQIISLLLTTEL